MADEITPEELVSELKRLRDRIPGFVNVTAREKQAMIRVAHLDEHLIGQGISAAAASKRVEAGVGWTAEALRQEQEAIGRWTAVENELRAMTDGVATANLKRRYGLGLVILQIYGIVNQVIREAGGEHLISYAQEMKRLTKGGFGHRKKKDPQE